MPTFKVGPQGDRGYTRSGPRRCGVECPGAPSMWGSYETCTAGCVGLVGRAFRQGRPVRRGHRGSPDLRRLKIVGHERGARSPSPSEAPCQGWPGLLSLGDPHTADAVLPARSLIYILIHLPSPAPCMPCSRRPLSHCSWPGISFDSRRPIIPDSIENSGGSDLRDRHGCLRLVTLPGAV